MSTVQYPPEIDPDWKMKLEVNDGDSEYTKSAKLRFSGTAQSQYVQGWTTAIQVGVEGAKAMGGG